MFLSSKENPEKNLSHVLFYAIITKENFPELKVLGAVEELYLKL
jgi:hypothetical protein